MATVSGGTKAERFGFIQAFGKELGVRYLCNWLGVSRSGSYAWIQRGDSDRARENRRLAEKIERIHKGSGGAYGSPRVFHALRRDGERIGCKRVERLMREAGLMGRAAVIYRRFAAIERFYRRYQNLKLDAPAPTRIDQQWVADLTYIKVGSQWRYLAVVLDVFSRRVIGWSLGANKTAELTLRALRHALRARNPRRGLIFHTDRGVEYGARLIQAELTKKGLRPSMNRPGSCTDNAHVESFFHSLKAERIHGVRFECERQLRRTLCEYINSFYNQNRLHSGLGYLSPAEYEKLAA